MSSVPPSTQKGDSSLNSLDSCRAPISMSLICNGGAIICAKMEREGAENVKNKIVALNSQRGEGKKLGLNFLLFFFSFLIHARLSVSNAQPPGREGKKEEAEAERRSCSCLI